MQAQCQQMKVDASLITSQEGVDAWESKKKIYLWDRAYVIKILSQRKSQDFDAPEQYPPTSASATSS